MSKGLGRIERIILRRILETKARPEDQPQQILITSWQLSNDLRPRDVPYQWGWGPTLSMRKAVVRAMHSFCRKFPEYALIGGQGRKELILYEPADPLSVRWAQLSVASREPISWKFLVAEKLREFAEFFGN